MKKVAIIQSNYIPWKGYFDIVNMVDEFFIFDEVQYTKRDFRNRNLIKTPKGLRWITIPVKVKNRYFQKINETIIVDDSWAESHWNQLRQNYFRSKYFKEYKTIFEDLYLNINSRNLSEINLKFLKTINKILGIRTKVSYPNKSSKNIKDKNLRLIEICKESNANIYLSGPSAKKYLDLHEFKNFGIKVEWMSYENYMEYDQLFPPFNHFVSILDLIFNQGLNAKKYMKSFRPYNTSL